MILKNGLVFVENSFQKLDVEIINGVFTRIDSDLQGEGIIECEGKRILPGMVDVHSHGCIGFDFATAKEEEIKKMQKYYASRGTTTVLGTVISSSKEVTFEAVSRLGKISSDKGSASVVGIQLEGPFFKPFKKGAHDENYLNIPSQEYIDELKEKSNGTIKLLAIDPLIENAKEVIEKYSKDFTISIAHTGCSYEEALEAVSWGATHVTHLFNAMNGMQTREPGVIGAFFDSKINAELICDGLHIHPSIVRLLFKAHPERVVLVSDSISPAGVEDGTYYSGGLEVNVINGEARLSNGTIAGSTSFLYDCFKKAMEFGVEPEKALLSATLYPAKSVGIDSKVGSISIGKQGDFIIVDENYNIENIFVNGGFVKTCISH